MTDHFLKYTASQHVIKGCNNFFYVGVFTHYYSFSCLLKLLIKMDAFFIKMSDALNLVDTCRKANK